MRNDVSEGFLVNDGLYFHGSLMYIWMVWFSW